MFARTMKVVDHGTTILEMKIVQVFDKLEMFLPGDKFILFNPVDKKIKVNIPKKSQIFINNVLIGKVEASGTIDIQSNHFTGLLHALYLH